MLKRSRDTAEYYMAELSTCVLEANDDVNYVLCAKQAMREAMSRLPNRISFIKL